MTEHRHASQIPGAAAWDLRVARAVPFAAVCTLIAAAGHALGGGGSVALPALAAGFGVVCAVAALLGGRERSLFSIAGLLGAGQLGLHLLFHSASGGMAGGGGMAMPQLALRLVCHEPTHGGLTVVPLDSSPDQLISAAGIAPQAYRAATPHAAGLFGLSPAMLLGHLGAAVLVGWWLRRGEAAVWRILRATATVAREWAAPLRMALALVAALLGRFGGRAAVRPPRRRAEDRRLPKVTALRYSVVRRGPPVAAFAR